MRELQIIEKIKNGSEDTLKKLYYKHKQEFISFGKKNSNLSYEILCEIYHDIIFTFYKNIVDEKLTELSCSVKTYLFSIGKNIILKEINRKTLIQTDYKDSIHNVTEEDNSSEEELISLLMTQLENIGEKCKELLTLFYFNRMKMENIASVMGFSDSLSAKTQKYKCILKLKNAVLKRNKVTF